MAKGVSGYYDLPKTTQYYYMYYYGILIVIGNDIMPSTLIEIHILTVVIFFGAFLEAYIIGGITAELMKVYDRNFLDAKNIDYLCYSMEIHNFPN